MLPSCFPQRNPSLAPHTTGLTIAMELRTFITKSLLDIVAGVRDAQNETPPGTIVADADDQATSFEWIKQGMTNLQVIDFEILVRADETAGKEAKIGVVGGIFGAGVSGVHASESSHESCIKLKIPIRLPVSGRIE